MNDLILESPRQLMLDAAGARHDNALTPLRHLLGSLNNNRSLAMITAALVFAVIMGLGLVMHQSRYAEAMLVIHASHQNLAQPDSQQASEVPPDTSAIDTEVEIMRSPAVAATVVRRLQLYNDPEFAGSNAAKPGLLASAVSWATKTMPFLSQTRLAQSAETRMDGDTFHRAVAAVMARSRIRRIGLTYMVQVGFVASSMQKAETIANAIVAAYMSQKLDQKLAAVKRANDDLGSTLAGLREKALQAESKVQEYVAKNGLLGPDSGTLAEGELSSLNQKLADAQADAAAKLASMAAAASRTQSSDSDGPSTIGVLRQREAEVSANLAQLQTQFGPEYPQVKKAQAELQDIHSEIQSETSRILSGLQAQAQVAERREAAIMSAREQVMNRIQSNNQSRVGLLPLQQAADSAKTIYETYLKRASEVTAERGLQQVDATVESKAVPGPDSPFSNLNLIALIATVLALIGSVVTVLLVEMWTPRVRSVSDVRRETGLPVVGLLPEAPLPNTANTVNCVAENHLTVVAEVFRSLSAYLAGAQAASHSKIIAVTSAMPGEGKTFTSVCLARTLAATGARVLLLDCDLRNPSTTRFFTRPQFGLAEIVNRTVSLDRALVRDEKSGIWFLSGTSNGEIPPFLFSDNRIDPLLNQLSERFDHIVLDTPPVLGFADARILASKASRVILLVRWNRTPAAIVNAAMEVLRLCNARMMGVVLNRVDTRRQAAYGFADGSDYYHYYKSAYPTVI